MLHIFFLSLQLVSCALRGEVIYWDYTDGRILKVIVSPSDSCNLLLKFTVRQDELSAISSKYIAWVTGGGKISTQPINELCIHFVTQTLFDFGTGLQYDIGAWIITCSMCGCAEIVQPPNVGEK